MERPAAGVAPTEYRIKSFLNLVLVVALAAYGGPSSSAPPGAAAPVTRAVFIGNSLTRHPPAAALGWDRDWGMAASTRERDYAHRSATALQVPMEAHNLSLLETDPAAGRARVRDIAARVDATTLVVVQLGDNVPAAGQATFAAAYRELLAALPTRRLVCLSTWWNNPSLDASLQQQCSARAGHYVYIGDIYTDPASTDASEPPFAVPAVNAHPHDWGMARIAERVVQAARR